MYEYNLQEKIEPCAPARPKITLKDHKDNFLLDPKFRLICPSKLDIGRLSKTILDKYIPILKSKLKLSLWKDTYETLNWFRGITDKSEYKFIQFDIDNYYSSSNPIVLNKALIFAASLLNYS